MATFSELINEKSMAHWALSGPRRLVKVFGASSRDHMRSKVPQPEDGSPKPPGGPMTGYITEERFLWGLNSDQIERLLGLRGFELRPFAYVYSLARLPRPDEVAFRLTAAFPDGRSIKESAETGYKPFHDEMMRQRADYAAGKGVTDKSYTPVLQLYGPGSNMIPQWQLLKEVPSRSLLATVTPILPFPRANGSVKPYTPHNRGPIR